MLELVRNVRYTVDDDEGSVMCLFRARYQMFDFIDEFIDHGIPFTMLTDGRMWTDRVQDYVSAIEKSDAGDPVNGLEARRLADMLQDSAFGTHERDEFYDFLDDREEAADADDISLIEVTTDELDAHIPFMPDANSADDMVRKVTSFQRKSMGAYFGGDYEGRTRPASASALSTPRRAARPITCSSRRISPRRWSSRWPPPSTTRPTWTASRSSRRPRARSPSSPTTSAGSSTSGCPAPASALVIMESLISGAPTLPISVLLFNELRDEPAQELVDEVQAELAVPEPEP